MKHTIMTVDGMFIEDENIIKEVKDMIHNALDYTYIHNKRVTVYSDKRLHDERVTRIEVEG